MTRTPNPIAQGTCGHTHMVMGYGSCLSAGGAHQRDRTYLVLARRGAHARCLDIREVQDAKGRASEPRAHDRVRRTHEHVPLLRDLALRPRGSAQDERVAGDHGWLLLDVQDKG